MQTFGKGFMFVALHIVNTIPLPKIAGGPPQDLRGCGWVLSRLMKRGKGHFSAVQSYYVPLKSLIFTPFFGSYPNRPGRFPLGRRPDPQVDPLGEIWGWKQWREQQERAADFGGKRAEKGWKCLDFYAEGNS